MDADVGATMKKSLGRPKKRLMGLLKEDIRVVGVSKMGTD